MWSRFQANFLEDKVHEKSSWKIVYESSVMEPAAWTYIDDIAPLNMCSCLLTMLVSSARCHELMLCVGHGSLFQLKALLWLEGQLA